MYRNNKVLVVMPAYNAARTLVKTYDEVMAQDYVDGVIVVDDASRDETVAVARQLKSALVHVHDQNRGYGGNQKSCYRLALESGGDIVIMVHPDYQYTPKLIPAMVSLIGNGLYHCVLGSRILGGRRARGACPPGDTSPTVSSLPPRIWCWARNFRSIIRVIGPFPGGCWTRCRWRPTPTISCSTTRCWPK